LGDGYGMPSSHSQFIWYFAVYGSLYMYRYIYLDHTVWKVLTSIAMFSLAILVAVSRIYLGYHTLNQVLIGSMVGTGYGALWYGVTRWVHSVGAIQWLVNTSIAKKLYLRDMSAVRNVARWEYEQYMKIKTQ
jgi:dolichyldiphosphatase